MEYITPQNVTFILGIIGVLFGVYRYFKDPQTNEEKKAALLAQQVQLNLDINEKRFSEMQNNIKEAFALAQNHTHTVQGQVEALANQVNLMNISITKLQTIIEERIPKK